MCLTSFSNNLDTLTHSPFTNHHQGNNIKSILILYPYTDDHFSSYTIKLPFMAAFNYTFQLPVCQTNRYR